MISNRGIFVFMDEQIDISSLQVWYSLTGSNSNPSAIVGKSSSGTGEFINPTDTDEVDVPEIIRSKIRSIEVASRNIKDCIPPVRSMGVALEEMQIRLTRMLELALQASVRDNDVAVDRRLLDREFQQLKSEIDRIADSVDMDWRTMLDDKSCG